MKLTTSTCYAFRHGGIGKTLNAIRETGFEGVDLGLFREDDEWSTNPQGFLNTVRSSGLFVGQAHAPIAFMRYGQDDYNRLHLPFAEKAIAVAAETGAPCIVFHPVTCQGLSREEQKEWNLSVFQNLGDIAKRHGTKIALENLWGVEDTPCLSPEELCDWFDTLNDTSRFTLCLDLGHFSYMGHAPGEAIRKAGKRSGVLHVHDNDGRFDQHLMPFFGTTDWTEAMKALREVEYAGNLNFEVVPLNKHVPDEAFAAGLRFLNDIGKTLLCIKA